MTRCSPNPSTSRGEIEILNQGLIPGIGADDDDDDDSVTECYERRTVGKKTIMSEP